MSATPEPLAAVRSAYMQAIVAGDWVRVQEIVENAPTGDEDDDPERLRARAAWAIHRAEYAVLRGELQEAEQALDRAYEVLREEVALWRATARLAERRGRWVAAGAAWRRVVEQADGVVRADAEVHLAELALLQGDHGRCEELLDALEDAHPTVRARVNILRAELYALRGDLDAARREWRAVRLDALPRDLVVTLQLRWAVVQSVVEPEPALRRINQAAKLLHRLRHPSGYAPVHTTLSLLAGCVDPVVELPPGGTAWPEAELEEVERQVARVRSAIRSGLSPDRWCRCCFGADVAERRAVLVWTAPAGALLRWGRAPTSSSSRWRRRLYRPPPRPVGIPATPPPPVPRARVAPPREELQLIVLAAALAVVCFIGISTLTVFAVALGRRATAAELPPVVAEQRAEKPSPQSARTRGPAVVWEAGVEGTIPVDLVAVGVKGDARIHGEGLRLRWNARSTEVKLPPGSYDVDVEGRQVSFVIPDGARRCSLRWLREVVVGTCR